MPEQAASRSAGRRAAAARAWEAATWDSEWPSRTSPARARPARERPVEGRPPLRVAAKPTADQSGSSSGARGESELRRPGPRGAASSSGGAATAGSAAGGSERRTVVIRGQVADRYSARRRAGRTLGLSGPVDARTKPDRAALWAVLLGLTLVLAALLSVHL